MQLQSKYNPGDRVWIVTNIAPANNDEKCRLLMDGIPPCYAITGPAVICAVKGQGVHNKDGQGVTMLYSLYGLSGEYKEDKLHRSIDDALAAIGEKRF